MNSTADPISDPHRFTFLFHQTNTQVLLLGDVMLGRLIDAAVLPHPVEDEWEGERSMTAIGQVFRSEHRVPTDSDACYARLWGDTADILRASACNMINLEFCFNARGRKFQPKRFNFRAHPANVGALTFVPVHFACLANNHILDYQAEGLSETLNVLEQARIPFAGAGHNIDEASRPVEIVLPNLHHRLHVTSFADHGSGVAAPGGTDLWAASGAQPGIWYVPVGELDAHARATLSSTIRESTERINSSLSVVSAHVGPNWSWDVSPELRLLATSLVREGGVGLFHGHSSHHIQGVEFIDGKPVIYGAGPFVDDYAIDSQFRNDLGFIYQYELPPAEAPPLGDRDDHHHIEAGLAVVWAHPIRIRDFRVKRILSAEDPDFKWLAATMRRLCHKLGSIAEVAEETGASGPCIRVSPLVG